MEGLFALFFLIAISFAFAYIRSPTVKGARGEQRVISHLRSTLDPKEYVVLNDLTLPANGATTQVDHVVVSRFGVFIIETKNMSGWIFGGEKQARWTQTHRRHKTQFQNPLRQNYKHLRTVQDLLPLPTSSLFSVVAFVGSAEPKTQMPPNVFWSAASLTIFILAQRQPLLSHQQMQDAVARLRKATFAPGAATQRAHIQNLRTPRMAKAMGKEPTCPRCQASMVHRKNRKTGDAFLGCSRFPKCRGTQKLT